MVSSGQMCSDYWTRNCNLLPEPFQGKVTTLLKRQLLHTHSLKGDLLMKTFVFTKSHAEDGTVVIYKKQQCHQMVLFNIVC